MSGVSNGQQANESTFDGAYMFSNGDTGTVGKVALNNNDPVSGPAIANTQRMQNEINDTVGITGEGDLTRKEYSSNNYVADGDSRKTAIEKLDLQLGQTQSDLDAAEVSIADHESRLDTIETANSTFAGDKTFSGNVVVQGNLQVDGTTTTVNSTNLEVVDKNILVNKNGNDASAEGAGVDVQRTSDNGVFRFDSTLASKWKIGLLSAMHEIIVAGLAQTISGIKDFISGLKTDSVSESTLNAGVTIDGVLIKDGNVDGRDVSADGSALDSHLANTSNPHATTAAQVGLANVTNDAQLKRAAGDFNSFTEKLSMVNDDIFLIEDSADSFNKKKVKRSNIGASGSGGGVQNFILNGDGENASSSIFVPYADTGSRPIDGTGGSPTVTTSLSTLGPLAGLKSYLLTKPASNTQGQGWAIPLTLDPAYRAKVLNIEFDYIVNSGTFVAGTSSADSDIIWTIYDVTNSQIIEPSSIKMLSNSSSISDKFKASFQSSATGSSYRLIAHCATTSAVAYEIKVDNIVITPATYSFGTPVTDWQSYTPIWRGATTNPAIGNGSLLGRWRRVGDSIEGQIDVGMGSTTTYGVGAWFFSLPSGLSFDSNKILIGNPGSVIGANYASNASTSNNTGIVTPNNSTEMIAFSNASGNNVNATSPFAWANGNVFRIQFRAPIAGWSSSVQTSDQTDTRIVSFVGTKTANESVTANTTNIAYATQKDSHGGWNGTQYQVQVAGDYIANIVGAAATNTNLVVYVNGVSTKGIGGFNTITNTGNVAVIPNLKVGDLISFRSTGSVSLNGDANSVNTLSINRISGPNQIAANEIVAVSAYNNSSQSFVSGSQSTVTNWTEYLDTHGAFNATTGVFTSPISSLYEISSALTFVDTVSSGDRVLYIRNQSVGDLAASSRPHNATGSGDETLVATIIVRVLAGEQIVIQGFQNSGSNQSISTQNSGRRNTLTIKRIGL